MPLSELGGGVYSLVGLKVYLDGSVLSKEKGNIHLGFGHAPGKTAEAGEMEEVAAEFYHTDFVLDRPTLVFLGEDGQREPIQVYPRTEEG